MSLQPYQYSKINPLRWCETDRKNRKRWKCKEHSHTGISHPSCYNKAHGIIERIGCLDIEAGSLTANTDIMLSWAIKTVGKDEWFYDHVTAESLKKGVKDRHIIESCINTMWKYDRLVVHYGKRGWYDTPFVRTRALKLGFEFPPLGMIWVSDTCTMSRQVLRLTSNRQGVIGETILDENVKTRVDFNHWINIKYGTAKEKKIAIDYIVDHNLKDVEQLEKVYLKFKPFCREPRTSI